MAARVKLEAPARGQVTTEAIEPVLTYPHIAGSEKGRGVSVTNIYCDFPRGAQECLVFHVLFQI